MSNADSPNILERVPTVDEVAARLRANVAESRALRRLPKLAREVQEARKQRAAARDTLRESANG